MKKQIQNLIEMALKEDIGKEDITTRLLFPSPVLSQGKIIVKEKGIICGLEIAKEVFSHLDTSLSFPYMREDGKEVEEGEEVMVIRGDGRNILKGERTALNFLGHLSGIATYTRKFVEKIGDLPVYILDTRKTTPGLRVLEKYAVRVGGGKNHRMGLYDMVLIKDNHLSILGEERKEAIRKSLRICKGKGFKIEIEVQNSEEALIAAEEEADIIMLDNMNREEILSAVKKIRERNSKVIIEVSGRVDLNTVREFALTGIDWISVGKITHSAPSLDSSLSLYPIQV